MAEPRHQRVSVTPLAPPDQPLRVRIVGPTEVFVTADVKSIRLKMFDGIMQLNPRYCSVIEKLREGEIQLKLVNSSATESSVRKYKISAGWLVSSHNLCELLVKSCQEVQ
ncbi:H+transporting two-sector ATPase delta/subunit epsilon [Candidatus Mycoplasma haematolamae str. Purdue]|uniref:H+transporting two-sector ATPase delta/subunit epsilon n=1 Tax=Mycoplasma haematolamae (strain Purdue) TaxID=1212765 RepID=I7CFI5_MYCHA|nr:ATP synthase F1 subunit epsilon [Candidatus Mycoplasma haematolamae]AFO51966.1 H+transporting two-sector ATPase delta/subunit epsilon [Candidatus Mycoplasma haematolamae str. Purdue]